MQEHQRRVVDERNELAVKVEKLRAFIEQGQIFSGLPVAEQARLYKQIAVMGLYLVVLEERIEHF